jgi:transcriptional regulator with XRE-family HTH domain
VADIQETPRAVVARQINKNVGRAIRQRRDDLGFTQGALAEQIGLSRASIANIEAGEQGMSVSTLLTIAHALELQGETLVRAAREGEVELPARELPKEASDALRDEEHRWVRGLLPDHDAAAG